MAVQVIKIQYDVDSSELDVADRKLENVSKEEQNVAANAKKMSDAIKKGSHDASKSTNDLNSSIKDIGATLIAAFTVDAILSFGKQIIATRGEFQKLEAVLTNTLGSSSAAQKALGDINKFAAQTNFGVVELTNNFVKLANQGFTPTIDEMRNLADLANSTGKTFDQLTEAIIDAQTGEFERLKEFGIRASKEGDNVKFTFKGVETQTKFTATAIRDYVLALGDLNGVAGSTEAISKTLVGQMSNLDDNFDQLFNTIGQGTEGVLTDFISLLNDSIATANRLLQTEEQLGKAQRQNTDALLNDRAKVRLNNRLEIEFLQQRAKGDKEYVRSFTENRSAEQKAEFDAFAQTSANRKMAAAEVIADLQSQLDNYRAIATGMSISATLAFKNSLKDQLDAAIKYYDELAAAEKKAEDAKNAPKKKEDIDKEYKQRLANLAEQERNELRLAKVNEMSKVYQLDIERQFNVKRVALFKEYNQQNVEELRGYNIRFKELAKDRDDAVIENNIKYKKLESQKVDIAQGTGELIRRIDLSTAEQNVANYYKERDAFIKAQKEKAAAIKQLQQTFLQGIIQLNNAIADRNSTIAQQEVQNNEKARERDLKNAENTSEQKKALKREEINQIKDEEERTKALRDFEERSNAQSKDRQLSVNRQYDEANRQIKRRAAEADRQQAEFNIIINAAQAVAKAYASAPPPYNIGLAALVGGLAIAQLAIIESTPLPTFAKGGFTGTGKDRDHTGERVAGIVHENEFVLNKHKTTEWRPLLEAIHRNEISPDDLNPKMTQAQFDYRQMKMAMSGALKEQPKNVFSFDQNGFTRHMESEGKKTTFRNKRYSAKS
jgi:hypothetical protein